MIEVTYTVDDGPFDVQIDEEDLANLDCEERDKVICELVQEHFEENVTWNIKEIK